VAALLVCTPMSVSTTASNIGSGYRWSRLDLAQGFRHRAFCAFGPLKNPSEGCRHEAVVYSLTPPSPPPTRVRSFVTEPAASLARAIFFALCPQAVRHRPVAGRRVEPIQQSLTVHSRCVRSIGAGGSYSVRRHARRCLWRTFAGVGPSDCFSLFGTVPPESPSPYHSRSEVALAHEQSLSLPPLLRVELRIV